MNTAPVPNPVIVVVDDDVETLGLTARLLERRFGADYLVIPETSAAHALEWISQFDRVADVCLILADFSMPEMTGVQLLRQCASVVSEAKRVVLADFAELRVARREIL